VKAAYQPHTVLQLEVGAAGATSMSDIASAKPEYDIFISYAREDEPRVNVLVAALESEGWKVFWDRLIPPGTTWEDFIGVHLDSAPVVITVWSTVSIKSRFVKAEANRALRRDVLTPVSIDSVDPPFGFEEINSLQLADWLAAGGGPLPKLLRKGIERKLHRNTSIPAPSVPAVASDSALGEASPCISPTKLEATWRNAAEGILSNEAGSNSQTRDHADVAEAALPIPTRPGDENKHGDGETHTPPYASRPRAMGQRAAIAGTAFLAVAMAAAAFYFYE